MTFRQKLNLQLGRIIRFLNPYWVERIMDTKDYRQSSFYGKSIDWRICDYSDNRYASSGMQVDSKLYLVGGYWHGAEVLDSVEEFDMESESWGRKMPLPVDAAESHMAVASDGFYLFVISGQKGPALSPSIKKCFAMNLVSGDWSPLPDLPEGRYAAAAVFHNGRIHLVGGAKENRHEGAAEHWSLEVKDGKANDGHWRSELPIPKPGVHRGGQLLDGYWYLIAGQESETPPMPGDPAYSFVPGYSIEKAFPDVFRYCFAEKRWESLSSIPTAVSHTDAGILNIDGKLVVLGGQLDQGDFRQDKIPVTDLIQAYDPEMDTWSVAGYLPFRIKLVVGGYHNGKIFFATGQKDTHANDAAAERFIGSAWCGVYP